MKNDIVKKTSDSYVTPEGGIAIRGCMINPDYEEIKDVDVIVVGEPIETDSRPLLKKIVKAMAVPKRLLGEKKMGYCYWCHWGWVIC